MRHVSILTLLVMALMSTRCVAPVHAVDHDNVDATRPLDFDDAETIAFREQALEFGASLVKSDGEKAGVAGEVEFLYGFAKNWHLNVGIDPSYLSQNGSRRFSGGNVSLGVQHNLNRETESSPAFGFRADAHLPTGRDARGVDFRLRGISSRKFGAYGRLHLNLDLFVNSSARADESSTRWGAIAGYSRPVGYPTRFDRTLVAQIGLRANESRGESAVTTLGIGMRQQVTPRSVFDIGLKSDVTGGRNRETLQVVAGYATAF
ncbi:MAG TPA: hypothetical protein VM821_06300 [Abditibacteriaceae bacterium]|nr:hypothetical protein [Abditibacteriaceae bacterium]